MKSKIFFFLSSALMTLGFAACSGSEDVPELNQPAEKQAHEIEIRIGLADTETRTTLIESESVQTGTASFWDWDGEGEELLLTNVNGGYVATLKWESFKDENNKNEAIFHGISDTEIKTGVNYLITYCGKGCKTNAPSFEVDLTNADGSKSGLGKSDVMSNIIVFSKHMSSIHQGLEVYYNEKTVELKKLFSVVHYRMIDYVENPTGTQVQGDGVYTKAKVHIGKIVADGDNVDIAQTFQVTYSDLATKSKPMSVGTAKDIYLTMAPGKQIAPVFKRTYQSGAVAYGTPGKTSEQGLTAGYIYNIGGDGKLGVPVDMKYNSLIEIENAITVTPWAQGSTGSITYE